MLGPQNGLATIKAAKKEMLLFKRWWEVALAEKSCKVSLKVSRASDSVCVHVVLSSVTLAARVSLQPGVDKFEGLSAVNFDSAHKSREIAYHLNLEHDGLSLGIWVTFCMLWKCCTWEFIVTFYVHVKVENTTWNVSGKRWGCTKRRRCDLVLGGVEWENSLFEA